MEIYVTKSYLEWQEKVLAYLKKCYSEDPEKKFPSIEDFKPLPESKNLVMAFMQRIKVIFSLTT